MNVLKRETLEKLTKAKKIRKKKIDQYRWTTTSRLKPKTITDIPIHPNTKPVAITVYKGPDRRNFDVHKLFRFGDYGVTKWDELGAIIPNKKNKVVEDLMSSLQKKKYQELEPEFRIPRFKYVFGDEAFQIMSDIHKVDADTLLTYLVMASNINTPIKQRMCAVLRSLIDSHPNKKKLKSKKVKLEAVGYSLN
ncbi:hypothetical protein Tco_1276679 [Tanacetum coccineum]